MGRLDEKIVIVTGANSGMGMATASKLARKLFELSENIVSK